MRAGQHRYAAPPFFVCMSCGFALAVIAVLCWLRLLSPTRWADAGGSLYVIHELVE